MSVFTNLMEKNEGKKKDGDVKFPENKVSLETAKKKYALI